MPESVSVLEGHDIILVRSWEDVSKTDMVKSREQVLRLAETRGITKVLVDTSDQLSLPCALELFEFVASTSRVLRRVDKIAMVRSNATGDDLEFIKSAALHRGLTARVVDSIPEAVAWLEEKPRPLRGV